MAQKKIDNLFQEQLKNLEVTPNKKVWNNIETQLRKKKRKVVPFWWLTATVASVLIVISVFYLFLPDESQNKNNTSNEIITTIPDKKNIVLERADTLQLDKNSTNNILISKKESEVKNQNKKNHLFTALKKEDEFHSKRKVASVVSNYAIANVSLKVPQVYFLPSNLKIEHSEKKKKYFKSAEINIKEEKPKAKKPLKNWSVASVFGVLQSNSLTDTSPINSSLASSTSGTNSYTYGIQIAYQLTDNWSVQSGIHLQEMGYANTQITIHNSSSNNPFATEFTNGAVFSFDINKTNENQSLASDFATNTFVANTGMLSQNYGYIEVPLEIKYNFLNHKKIKSAVVTGFSTLFLNKNEVILNTQNFSTKLEAANLNSVNFSGNLGFDMRYILSEKWSFQVNPMFKVQFNTFTDTANNFAPFNFGMYSGIIYQF
ncbi:hypothetical protein [Polaribacter sp. M15]